MLGVAARDPPGSLNPKLTPYLASRSPIPRLVRDTTRSLQKLAVSLLTYDISAIDYGGQRIILDGFCGISRLKGMPTPQGAVVVASGGSHGRGGGNALRAIPRADPRFGQYGRGRMVLGEQSCEKSWPSSTTTAAISPASPITCSTASLRPKSSMRCCAFPIPISKQFLS